MAIGDTKEAANRASGSAADASKTDKRKQSLYFPESMLQEIKEEAARLDRSLSWVVQRAWKISRLEIKKLPSVNDVEGVGEPASVHRDPADADAFDRLDEMRGGEQPGVESGRAERRFDHGADRAFPVGSRDMDESAIPMGISQAAEELGDAIQSKLGRLDFVAQRVEEMD